MNREELLFARYRRVLLETGAAWEEVKRLLPAQLEAELRRVLKVVTQKPKRR